MEAKRRTYTLDEHREALAKMIARYPNWVVSHTRQERLVVIGLVAGFDVATIARVASVSESYVTQMVGKIRRGFVSRIPHNMRHDDPLD